MKSWQIAVLGLAPLLIAGCRSDPAIPLLERELYRKDREISELKYELQDLREQNTSCPERSTIRDRSSEEREPESRSYRNHHESNGMTPPAIDHGTPAKGVPDTLKQPGVTLPPDVPEPPPGIQGPTRGGSRNDGPALEGGPEGFSMHPSRVTLASASSPIPFRPSGDSRRVASIVLDPANCGGIGSNDGGGDRGLLVVVQPHDARGRMVDATAEIHVTAFDRSLRGEAARVGRGDYSPAETAALFCRTASGGAIHLAMGWPERPPTHNKLQVFVRYVTADGRRLDASRQVEIALPGERPARWTAAERPVPAERAVPTERLVPTERAVPREPLVEREPPANSLRADEAPAARSSEPPPYIASRTAEPGPERPVWSPERR